MSKKIDYEIYHKSNRRSQLSGFEIARWDALSHFIPKQVENNKTFCILDYGAGTGLHVELWKNLFPNSDIYLTDISEVGRSKCLSNYKELKGKYKLIKNKKSEFESEKFDVILSIEVMEHVPDLFSYLKDIFRLLRPGGIFIWTTPCGNFFSIEHIYSALTNQIIRTGEGYIKWKWEDPTHLRRLKSKEIENKLISTGFSEIVFRFRAHIFSFLCTYFPPRHRFQNIRNKIMKLDYDFLRLLPNGASMIGKAHKPKPKF